MKIDKIYCINLDNEKKRWNNINGYCKRAKINLNRFSAVNAENLNLDILLDKKIILSKNIKCGGLANALSHTFIWEEALRKQYEYIVVFEDDCIIPPNFWDKISSIDNDFYFDILFLGGSFVKGCKLNNTYIIPKIIKGYSDVNVGFFAYILNCKIINFLVDKIFPYKMPIDVCVKTISNKSNLILYYMYPHLIKHDFGFRSTRLYIDYKKSFYSDKIIKNYNEIELTESINFIIIKKRVSNIDEINEIRKQTNNCNVLVMESNCVLQKNAFYFIKKYTQTIPKNWSILIISNKNIVEVGRIFICNHKNYNNNFYALN